MCTRAGWLIVSLVLAVAGCGGDGNSGGSTSGGDFISNQRVVYSDGLHSENTEMIRLDDRILLIFRGGETGQTGSSKARIKVFASMDEGKTFTLLSEVSANNLPGERDIRDPKLVEMNGTLFLYAISRLPGAHYRDLGGNAWLVRAESTDRGESWTLPEKTYADLDAQGVETPWGFWRHTKRQYMSGGQRRETLYATAYTDLDTAVGFFATDDGVHWEKRSLIIDSYDDVPSEAELKFFGDNQEKAVALVRLDNQDILADGQTAICTATDPFLNWECGRRIEQRLDGPTWIVRDDGGKQRNFVFARKHLPCTYKRTAAYELRGDLTDPAAPIQVCEIKELMSSGDTAYTALAPLSEDRYLLSWYSSPVDQELPWFEGISSPSDIWLADVDFSNAPADCTPPPAKRPCAPAALPSDGMRFDISGDFLLTLAPVIWPDMGVSFTANVDIQGDALTLKLQPLDAVTQAPVGAEWISASGAIDADGRFMVSFGSEPVPPQAYPLLNDPFLTLNELVFTGQTTGADRFCGNVLGYGQVFGVSPSDRVRLEGTTFGGARIMGATQPAPINACD